MISSSKKPVYCFGVFYRPVIVISILVIALVVSAPHRVTAIDPGSETLTALEQTTIPVRDPVDLARRLLGVTTIPTPPASATNYEIGATLAFNAVNDATGQTLSFPAQLWYATPHVYMWFEKGYTPDMTAVKTSADHFETQIYPTVHRYFGSEPSPGIDGDVHLYLVHAKNLGAGVGGYFDVESESPKVIAPRSNEHEMFFINLDTMGNQIGKPSYEGVLAHEFQHMVHANVGNNQASWLDEGLAELSAFLNGYRDNLGFTPAFMQQTTTQLNSWPDIADSNPNYGGSFLFAEYFLERFGEQALKTLETDPKIGLNSVGDALQKINAHDPATGKPISLEQFFADWTLTNLLNDPKGGDGRFAYKNFKQSLPALKEADPWKPGTPLDLTLNQWGATYLPLATPGTYTLDFQGTPTVKVVPTTAHSGQRFWWSNRADRIDTRLTHAFDLRTVKTATLDYWMWYALEEGWDYGYVEISTDGGQTWKALASNDSLPVNDKNAYGPGYTGNSGGTKSPAAAQWRHETIDLSRYAGKQVLLRFECLTDAAINKPGIALDDISIPEIGYHTDAENDDGGWTAEGWVRIENALPERYLLQLVTPGAAIMPLLSPADGTSGHWTIQVNVGSPSVLILSSLTQFTTETTQVHLTLSPSS